MDSLGILSECRASMVVLQNEVSDLGCTIEEFILYLEGQFTGDMRRETYGEVWEIDHIKPLSKFDLTDHDQFRQACHYTNMQPLLIGENRSKKVKSMEEWRRDM